MTDKRTAHQSVVRLYRQAVADGVPVSALQHRVETWAARKQLGARHDRQTESKTMKVVKRALPFSVRVIVAAFPFLSVFLGLVLVANAGLPILWYYVQPSLTQQEAVAPIPRAEVLRAGVASTQVLGETDRTPLPKKPVVLSNELDYSNLANWFGADTSQIETLRAAEAAQASQIQEYIIDIPKVNIANAHVKIGGVDLGKSLIQYPGTASPGDDGSPVIFGHSVLRQFYNPQEKNPRRYMSIFSTIMTLKTGDEIFITANGVKYTYRVQEKVVVKPEDTYILEQDYGQKRLKLVTCVPEGTYLNRGVLIADLVQ